MLELISKYFMVNGEQALSLESMIINSDDNLEVEENEEETLANDAISDKM